MCIININERKLLFVHIMCNKNMKLGKNIIKVTPNEMMPVLFKYLMYTAFVLQNCKYL